MILWLDKTGTCQIAAPMNLVLALEQP